MKGQSNIGQRQGDITLLFNAGMFSLLELSLLLAFNVNGICWCIEGSHMSD